MVGPSGAGKTSFIKMMYREEVPSKGEVYINNVELGRLKKKDVPFLRRDIGVIFQDFKLLQRKSVYENVSFALEVIEENPKKIRRRVMSVLDQVGLKHKARFYSSTIIRWGAATDCYCKGNRQQSESCNC
nr:ATP-binding cassette domain-containing protein [Piscibacillus salipiscarius]